MARNEEKANSMLNRFWAAKNGMLDQKPRRPRIVAKCSSLQECQQWRLEVIKEITKQVAAIQNTTLPEDRIRALNDEINKLLREKSTWESHIRALGGPNYEKIQEKVTDADGTEVIGSGGYRYFGAAKTLPGVQELLSSKSKNKAEAEGQRTRAEMARGLDAFYYGYGYDEGEAGERIRAKEAELEEKLIAAALQSYEQKQKEKERKDKEAENEDTSLTPSSKKAKTVDAEGSEDEFIVDDEKLQELVKPHHDLEALVLARRKAEVLRKFKLEAFV